MKIKSNFGLFSCLLLSLTLAASLMSASAGEPPQAGAVAPDFSLNTMDAKSVTLSAETAKQPVVLVVLRGWPGSQCPLCTRQVHEFAAHAEAFAGKARVIMVYPGPAQDLSAHAEQFLKDKQWPKDFIFLTDPDYAFTKSFGLRWDAPGETAYPSTFVIDTKDRVQFVKISKSHGDRTTSAEVLAALARLK